MQQIIFTGIIKQNEKIQIFFITVVLTEADLYFSKGPVKVL